MKASLTIATTAMFLALSMGNAAADTPLRNFEADYPKVQSVPGEAPQKGYTLSPNHPNWPQTPAIETDTSSRRIESQRDRNFDAKAQHYLA